MTSQALDYSNLIQAKIKDFTGREWLDREFNRFLQSGQERYFLLCGEPGIGKTCFAAHLVARDGYVHHFISAQDLDWRSPLAFAHSVAAQLSRRYGIWVLSEDSPPPNFNINIPVGSVEGGSSVIGAVIEQYVGMSIEEEFRRLVLRPLQRLSKASQGVITLVIDGLDEAAAYSGAPTIQDLVSRLGSAPGARLLITANPGPVLDAVRRQINPTEQVKFDMDGSSPDNLEDCRRFLEQAVQSPEIAERLLAGGLDPLQFVEQALAHSEGNFLYLAYLLDALQKGVAIDLDDLPAGLERVYEYVLAQVVRPDDPEWFDLYMPVLGILAIAPAPLTEVEITKNTGLSTGQVRKALGVLRTFLEVDETLPLNQRTYRLYHRAFARFLLDAAKAGDYWIDAQSIHSQVVDRLLPTGADPANLEDGYALRFLAYHMRHAGGKQQQTLMTMMTPELCRASRQRTGSDLAFHLDLGEAIAAALEQPMPDRLVDAGAARAGRRHPRLTRRQPAAAAAG